eukprot:scaffold637_cov118-Isochrysis_galbana.AAC.8
MPREHGAGQTPAQARVGRPPRWRPPARGRQETAQSRRQSPPCPAWRRPSQRAPNQHPGQGTRHLP